MTGLPYIAARKAADPTNAAEWDQIENLHDDKLWHQLTERLVQLTRSKHFGALSEDDTKKFYTEFVIKFEKKINRLMLAELVISVCDRCGDPQEAIELLTKTMEKVLPSVRG